MIQPTEAALQAAQMYEHFMVPLMFAPWAAVLLDFAGVQAGEQVLDVACGTGSVARQAAGRVGPGGAVSALDISPAMLAVARQSAAPDAPVIDWQQGSAQELPFDDAAFAAVLCQQGLQFFASPVGALREMRRVLRVGGRAALLVNQPLEHNPLYHRLSQAAHRRTGVELFAAAFALSDPDRLELLLTTAGFVDIQVRAQSRPVRYAEPQRFIASILQGAAAAVPALAAISEAQRRSLTDQLQGDLADWLSAQTEGGELVTEMGVYLAQGRRPDGVVPAS